MASDQYLIVELWSRSKVRAYAIIQIHHHHPPTPQLFKKEKRDILSYPGYSVLTQVSKLKSAMGAWGAKGPKGLLRVRVF